MKLATVRHRDQTLYGQVIGDRFYPAQEALKARYATLKDLISDGSLTQLAAQQTRQEDGIDLAKVSYLPPIPEPGKIICIGLNYRKPYPVDGVAPPTPVKLSYLAKSVIPCWAISKNWKRRLVPPLIVLITKARLR